MKKILAITVTLAIVGLIGTVFAFPALAHSSESDGSTSGVTLDQPTLTRVAETLGLTVGELTFQLQQGNTLETIAAARGVSADTMVATLIAPYHDLLQLQVGYGYITQEQGDAFLKDAQEHARDLLTQNFSGQTGAEDDTWDEMVDECNEMMGDWSGPSASEGGWGGMMGPGMMGGWGSYGYQSDKPGTTVAPRGFFGIMSDWGHSFSRGWGNMMRGAGSWGHGMMGW